MNFLFRYTLATGEGPVGDRHIPHTTGSVRGRHIRPPCVSGRTPPVQNAPPCVRLPHPACGSFLRCFLRRLARLGQQASCHSPGSGFLR